MKLSASIVVLALASVGLSSAQKQEARKERPKRRSLSSKGGSKSGSSFGESSVFLQEGQCEICSSENKDNKPNQLTLEYVGGQGKISAYQPSDKASCRDQMFPSGSTTVTSYGRSYEVSPGSTFTISGFDGDGKLDANSFFSFPGGMDCFFHTSCSVPLVAGDQLGPFIVLEDGNSCTTNTFQESASGECEICNKENKVKPTTLTLEYTGGTGGISQYQPEDKASCRNQVFADSTTVTAYGQSYQVSTGTVFTISDGGDTLDAETDFNVGGIECYIHTSCSVPLVVGDRIGPFTVLQDGNNCLGTPPFTESSNGQCEICSKENKIRPTSLTLEYFGGQGAISAYQPEDKADCRNQMFPDGETVVTAYGQSYQVSPGGTFTISQDKLDAETDFGFSNGIECFIHTSCSVPLVAGDRIGPFRILEGNNCKFEEAEVTPAPTPCVCRAHGSWDGSAVTVKFDYCDDAQPEEFDLIGIYPCDAPTLVTDAAWDASVAAYNAGRGGFEFGYVEGNTYVGVEPLWWAYTCGDTGSKCQQDDNTVWPSKGEVRIDPATAVDAPWFFYEGGTTLEDGCYKVMLNRYPFISAPPYVTTCADWEDASSFDTSMPAANGMSSEEYDASLFGDTYNPDGTAMAQEQIGSSGETTVPEWAALLMAAPVWM